MALSTNMAICIAMTAFASAAVYFVLRARISAIEHQVDALTLMAQTTAQARVLEMRGGANASSPLNAAAIVESAQTQLLEVSEEEGSDYTSESEYTSDEDGDGLLQVSSVPTDPSTIKTVVLAPAASADSGLLGPSSLDNNDTEPHEQSAEDSAEDSDDESDGDSSSGESESSSAEASVTTALAAINIKSLNCESLRALVSEHGLAPNPTKLRKGELQEVLRKAQEH